MDGADVFREPRRFAGSLLGDVVVFDLDLVSYAVPAGRQCGQCCASGARERVENGVARERKHFDEPFREAHGKRGRVSLPRAFAANIGPCRTHPPLHFLLGEHRKRPLHGSGRAVVAALAEEKNVFDIILHDGTRLIRLAVKSRPVALGLGGTVCNFLPEDRSQAIEAELPAAHLDVGVERHDEMATILLAGNAHVSDDAANPATGGEHACALGPNFVELAQKRFVVMNLSKLVRSWFIVFQGPVGRRGNNKVDAPRFDPREIPRVAEAEVMGGSVKRCRPGEISENAVCAKHFLDRSGRIVSKGKFA